MRFRHADGGPTQSVDPRGLPIRDIQTSQLRPSVPFPNDRVTLLDRVIGGQLPAASLLVRVSSLRRAVTR